MRARPVGPADRPSSTILLVVGRRREAHPRALHQPDGLLRSVAGRLTSANGPRLAPIAPSPPEGPIKGGVEGPIKGGIKGPLEGPIQGAAAVPGNAVERAAGAPGITRGNSAMETVRGPKSASARPGPCTRPRSADALTRREYHPARQTPASRSVVLGRRRRRPGTAQGPAGGLRGLHLDPGSGRMVPMTRVGRSALRAAAPAGRGRSRRPRGQRNAPQARASNAVAGAATDSPLRVGHHHQQAASPANPAGVGSGW
jgi:hypothetical protein